MPTYRYEALNPAGERRSGVLAAPGEQAVLAELERQRLTPTLLREQKAAVSSGGGVKQSQLAVAYTQMGDLLSAGVPLLRALRVVSNRKKAPKVGQVFSQLADAVQDGEELADAMAERPEIFPATHAAMIRAAEKGAFLEETLKRLGQLVASQVELRQKVTGALIYPSVILVVGLTIFGLVLAIYVPQFRPLYADLQLGITTRLVLASSELITRFWFLLVLGVVGGIFGLRWAFRRPEVREPIVGLSLRTPVVGPLIRALATARACRILGTMLSNGVPMLGALRIARDATGLSEMALAIDGATEAVRSGQRLSTPLAESGLFDEEIVEMLSVAEAANNLDTVLLTAAETLERRVDQMVTIAVRLIEPVLLLLLGIAVSFVAIGLILPMLQLTRSV